MKSKVENVNERKGVRQKLSDWRVDLMFFVREHPYLFCFITLPFSIVAAGLFLRWSLGLLVDFTEFFLGAV